MQNFLINNNFSLLSAGFATVRNDTVWINYLDDSDEIPPQQKKWSSLVPVFAYHRLYLAIDGQATLKLTDGSELTMEKGKMYLIPPFKISSVGHTDFFSHFYLHFKSNTQMPNPFEYYDLVNPVAIDERDIGFIRSLLPQLRTLLTEKSHRTLSAELQTQGYFSLLISKLFRESGPLTPAVRRFTPILEYIDSHMSERISVKQLADLLGYNEAYFSTLFSQHFKISPLKFIIEKKMVLACQQLAHSDLSIRQISSNLGFENEFYFNTVFKKSFGISPGKWKQWYISQNGGSL